MNDFLTGLVSVSLGGAIVILVLAIAARCSRSRYAARWRCWVWLVLSLRLLFPFPLLPERQITPVQIEMPDNAVIFTPGSKPSSDVAPVPHPDKPPQDLNSHTEEAKSVTLSQTVAILWAMGAMGTAAWAVIAHLRFLAYVRRWGSKVTDVRIVQTFNALGDMLNLEQRPEMKCCKGLKAPMLAGVFRSVLLLPEENMNGNELRYALLHELTHFKRRDIRLKSLCLLARCVHWFNPMVWYMARLVERDTELGCDEAALNYLPAKEHGAYGETIIHAVERLNAAP